MNVFLQVIQCSPLSSEIPFPYILSSLFFLAEPSAVYSNLIHFCPARYSSTSNRLGNWSHTTRRFVYAEKRVGAYTDTWLFYLKILLMGKIAPRHGLVRNLHIVTTLHLFVAVKTSSKNSFSEVFREKRMRWRTFKNSDLDLIRSIQPGGELFGFIVMFSMSLKDTKSHFGIRNTDLDFP